MNNEMSVNLIILKYDVRDLDPPGEPQKSVKRWEELNRVLKPKSHTFRSMHFPLSLSNVSKIFSGLRSAGYFRADYCDVQ